MTQLTSIFLADYEMNVRTPVAAFAPCFWNGNSVKNSGYMIPFPGFVHAKVYLSDDKYGIVGTINLDYRSLVHHFENGVWIYRHEVLKQIKCDLADTMEKSIEMGEGSVKDTLLQRLIRVLVIVLSPLL